MVKSDQFRFDWFSLRSDLIKVGLSHSILRFRSLLSHYSYSFWAFGYFCWISPLLPCGIAVTGSVVRCWCFKISAAAVPRGLRFLWLPCVQNVSRKFIWGVSRLPGGRQKSLMMTKLLPVPNVYRCVCEHMKRSAEVGKNGTVCLDRLEKDKLVEPYYGKTPNEFRPFCMAIKVDVAVLRTVVFFWNS